MFRKLACALLLLLLLPVGRAEGYSVTLNRYEPAPWNGGYGHYDMTIRADSGERLRWDGADFQFDTDAITLSYGATDGDNSPGRVRLYRAARDGQANGPMPVEELRVCEALSREDFEAFMAWFAAEFAAYDSSSENFDVFLVTDDAYSVYNLSARVNCATALRHMLRHLPGALAEMHAGFPETAICLSDACRIEFGDAKSFATPSPLPTRRPAHSQAPTARPTETPAATGEPTAAPTQAPEATVNPTEAPAATAEPTAKPTPEATAKPTEAPAVTEKPGEAPAAAAKPTAAPAEEAAAECAAGACARQDGVL